LKVKTKIQKIIKRVLQKYPFCGIIMVLRIPNNPNTSIINRSLGRAFINGQEQPQGTPTSGSQHGTMTAGVVSTAWNGATNSINGVSGNVTLVPLKIEDGIIGNNMYVNNTIAAISYATTIYNNTNTQIPILNASLRWYRNDGPYIPAIIETTGFNAMQQAIMNYPGLLRLQEMKI